MQPADVPGQLGVAGAPPPSSPPPYALPPHTLPPFASPQHPVAHHAQPPYGLPPAPAPPAARSWSRTGTVIAVTTAILSAAAAIGYDSDARSPDGALSGIHVLAFLVGMAVAGLLVLRRSRPVLVTLVASGAALLLPLDSFAALLGLTWVIASSSRRTAWLCGAAAATATAVALWRDAAREPAFMVLSSKDALTGEVSYASPVMFCIVGVACVGAAVGVGLVRRSRQVAVAAVADKEAAVVATRDQLTRQEERELIAREVHDTVAHHISLISLQASALEVDRGAGEPAVRAAAQQMRSSAQQAIAEMRGLLTTLRTGGEDDSTPGATLEDLAELLDGLRRHGRWVTSSVYVSDAHEAAPVLTRAVFRIVQESVTNAMKHAPGQPIEVEVRAGRQVGVSIKVANPLGPNAPAALSTGSGLVGMRERAQRLGGQLEVEVTDGWHIVTARLPWVER